MTTYTDEDLPVGTDVLIIRRHSLYGVTAITRAHVGEQRNNMIIVYADSGREEWRFRKHLPDEDGRRIIGAELDHPAQPQVWRSLEVPNSAEAKNARTELRRNILKSNAQKTITSLDLMDRKAVRAAIEALEKWEPVLHYDDPAPILTMEQASKIVGLL